MKRLVYVGPKPAGDIILSVVAVGLFLLTVWIEGGGL